MSFFTVLIEVWRYIELNIKYFIFIIKGVELHPAYENFADNNNDGNNDGNNSSGGSAGPSGSSGGSAGPSGPSDSGSSGSNLSMILVIFGPIFDTIFKVFEDLSLYLNYLPFF